MTRRVQRVRWLTLATAALGLSACWSAPHPKTPAARLAAVPEPQLGDVTLQSALEAAWDGDFLQCYKRARTAVSIAADDLEAMELTMRCAHAQRVLPEAISWVRSSYAKRLDAPVVQYALGVATLLRGELGEARKVLDKVAPHAPAAAYHAAIAAQLDDDVLSADRWISVYVKANPTEPAGRVLQTEIICAIDLVRCNAALETIKSTDDDDAAIARRLGAAVAGPVAVSRARLAALAKDADVLGSPAFNDALTVAAALREGSDPAIVLVRSPRSGRPEPGPGVDLVRLARPTARLPFATRVVQLATLGDPAAPAMFSRMSALFPTELSTWRLARRWDKTATAARKELERSAFTRWRGVVATTLARPEESCELIGAFAWSDRGPIATSTRARCEIALDPVRGRKIADARLSVTPFGALDVEVAIEGEAAVKDAAALEALARSIAKIAPSSTLVAAALWAAGDAASAVPGKKSHALWAEALAQTAYDPLVARRLLQKYVDHKDVPRSKAVLGPALAESPNDAFLSGVQGEILLHEGKVGESLPFLTRSCLLARARREQDVLANTLVSLNAAIAKSKSAAEKPAREAGAKCAKGE